MKWYHKGLQPRPRAGGAIHNCNMHYVYLLKSEKDHGYYIGFTNDLKRRFYEHSNRLVTSTKNRNPLRLIYYEGFENEKAARKRERQLKLFGSAYKGLLKRL